MTRCAIVTISDDWVLVIRNHISTTASGRL